VLEGALLTEFTADLDVPFASGCLAGPGAVWRFWLSSLTRWLFEGGLSVEVLADACALVVLAEGLLADLIGLA